MRCPGLTWPSCRYDPTDTLSLAETILPEAGLDGIDMDQLLAFGLLFENLIKYSTLQAPVCQRRASTEYKAASGTMDRFLRSWYHLAIAIRSLIDRVHFIFVHY